MITIYSVPVSLYCAKLRIVLRHKDLAFEELPPPGGYGSDEYRAMVPSGNLPAMIHDGFSLADSEAIAEYLNEAFPMVPMLPDDLRMRAKAREKSRLHDTRLEPNVRALFPYIAHDSRDPAAVAQAETAIGKNLAALDLLLSQETDVPAHLWLCDCGFAVTFAWIDALERAIGLRVEWPETVRAYQNRLTGFAAVATELTAYEHALSRYLEAAKPPQG